MKAHASREIAESAAMDTWERHSPRGVKKNVECPLFPGGRGASREDGCHGLPLDQLARLVEVVVDDRIRLDADRVVDGGEQFRRVYRMFDRGAGGLVALAVDVAAAEIDPLQHYLQFGAAEGRDPSATFSTAAYLAANPDVEEAGANPLQHYLQFGIAENRPLAPEAELV